MRFDREKNTHKDPDPATDGACRNRFILYIIYTQRKFEPSLLKTPFFSYTARSKVDIYFIIAISVVLTQVLSCILEYFILYYL